MSNTDEDELVGVMSDTLDKYELDNAEPAEPDKRPDPVGMVARAMVAATVAGRPDLTADATVRGAVVILIIPFGWVDSVAGAWRRSVLGQPENQADDDGYAERRRRERASEKWPLGVVADQVQKDWAQGSTAAALRTGRGVLVSLTTLNGVDAGLRAAADMEVTISPPTPEILRAVAEDLSEGVGMMVDATVAAAVCPGHLLGCLRPGQTASSYLARVERVSAVTIPPARAAATPHWTLDRLHGNPEIRAWGKGLAADMRAYAAGTLPWEDVAPGILLSGPPGCGKTLTAQAIAFECGVPLIVTSYSEWQGSGKEGHLGEVTKCLRSVFHRARLAAPCIVFLDELDSVRGRSDSVVSVRAGHDEWWTAITNALLEELDGVNTRPGIVFIGASNHPGKVDAALRRSGRLDREIRLSPPDAAAIAPILREHLGDHLPGADLSGVAIAALGATGADVASWVREARQVARHAGKPMELADLMTAISPAPDPGSLESRRCTAIHEAGHAVLTAVTAPGALRMVSIRAGVAGRASMGGVEIASPGPNQTSAGDVEGVLMRIMGGRAAEALVFGECGGGSGGPKGSDLALATLVAASAELCWGMGPRISWICEPEPETLGHVLAVHRDVAVRVEQRLVDAQARATTILAAHLPGLHALADALMGRETLTGEAAEAILREASS